MPIFSKKSLDRKNTCHPELIALFDEVIKYRDCTVLDGHRGKDAQNKAYREGKSKLRWPNGKHNKNPSDAIDVAPYPIDWNDIERFKNFAKIVFEIYQKLKAEGKITRKLRWGGDFNMNGKQDDKFLDFVHWELI